jgi:hypothetical protein
MFLFTSYPGISSRLIIGYPGQRFKLEKRIYLKPFRSLAKINKLVFPDRVDMARGAKGGF